jgi:hypothetical protein
MAMELIMRLDPSGQALVPVDTAQAQELEELQLVGGEFKVKVTQVRNPGFHRKGMAMFRFLFNLWEPVLRDGERNGAPVAKDFDAFRGNLTISAGFYKQVFNLEGGFELIPQPLKWSSMDNIKFERVYSEVLNVGLEMIGKAGHITPEQADAAINHLLGFA